MPERPAIEKLIEELEKQNARQHATQTSSTTPELREQAAKPAASTSSRAASASVRDMLSPTSTTSVELSASASRESPDIYERWWFWAAIGIAAAAVAGGVAAATLGANDVPDGHARFDLE